MIPPSDGSTETANPRLREALRLAACNLRVFPCRWPTMRYQQDGRELYASGKEPLTAHGFRDATTDPEQIERWWARWPRANVAIATGVGPHRPFVIDLDLGADGDGRATWRALGDPGRPFQRTPSGGEHRIFRMPEGPPITIGSRRLGPGVDHRGVGGYVVVAPSQVDIHAKERTDRGLTPEQLPPDIRGYQASQSPLGSGMDDFTHPLPESIVLVLRRPERGPTVAVPQAPRPLPSTPPQISYGAPATPWGRAVLTRACMRIAGTPEGQRHSMLVREATCVGGYVASGEIEESSAFSELCAAAIRAGLAPHEAARTAFECLQNGKRRPLHVPEPTPAPVQAHSPKDSAAAPAAGPGYRSLGQALLESRLALGRRLPTGLPTLDRALRGGVPCGQLLVLAGAPGAAKTSFATYLMDRWLTLGAVVVFLAADEAPSGVLTRLGQQANFNRELLESDSPEGQRERAEFAAYSEGSLGVVLDPHHPTDASTLEGAAKVVHEVAKDRTDLPRVLIVDSLQLVRCEAAQRAETMRERIDIAMGVLRKIAQQGVLVVVISEMARAGYRTGDAKVDISALAAGRESCSIEYGASVLVGLRTVRGEIGLSELEVAKNRIGVDRPLLRMRLDFARASFAEVAAEGPDSADSAQEAGRRKRVLRTAGDGLYPSAEALARAVGGRRIDVLRIIRELRDEGALEMRSGALRPVSVDN